MQPFIVIGINALIILSPRFQKRVLLSRELKRTKGVHPLAHTHVWKNPASNMQCASECVSIPGGRPWRWRTLCVSWEDVFFLSDSFFLPVERNSRSVRGAPADSREAPITQEAPAVFLLSWAQSRCPRGVPRKETFGCLTGNTARAPPRDPERFERHRSTRHPAASRVSMCDDDTLNWSFQSRQRLITLGVMTYPTSHSSLHEIRRSNRWSSLANL